MLKGFPEPPVCLSAGWHSKRWYWLLYRRLYCHGTYSREISKVKMTEIKRCIQTRLPSVETASYKKESTANLGKEGEGRLPLLEHRGWKGYQLLVMISESEGRQINDNSLILWHEGEGWRRKSKCLIHCLSLHMDQTQHHICCKGQEGQGN